MVLHLPKHKGNNSDKVNQNVEIHNVMSVSHVFGVTP